MHIKNHILEEGTKVSLSILGHNNFLYPSKYIGFINKRYAAERLSWASPNGKTPYKVPVKYIDTEAEQHAGEYAVVWID